MHNVTQEQEDYINSNIAEHVFLEACPGSGKTEVIAYKVAKEIEHWKKLPGGMAILSFSNSATDELKDRIIGKVQSEINFFPHFIGTFDSFIYKYIVNPLSDKITEYKGEKGDATIRIIDNSSKIGFKTKYSYARQGNIYANQFNFNIKGEVIFDTGDRSRDGLLNSVVLEQWHIEDLKNTKNRLINAGYATYSDVENLALKCLNDNSLNDYKFNLSLRYSIVIIDECQDLSATQIDILMILIKIGIKVHLIGDMNQSIYGFRDANPVLVLEFIKKYNFRRLQLTYNFRNCNEIVDLCGKLIGNNEIKGNYSSLLPSCMVLEYDQCPTELVNQFIEYFKEYENCVVVARGYSVLSKFKQIDTKLKGMEKLALAIYYFDMKSMEKLTISLELFSSFLNETLKVPSMTKSFYCPQIISSKLIWRQFLANSLGYLQSEDDSFFDISWSEWVRGVKGKIQKLSEQSFIHEDIIPVINVLNTIQLRAPNGKAEMKVSDLFEDITSSESISYRKDTIHGVKGETHDITILVSAPDARGGTGSHWKSWIKNDNSEAVRFAYVASSRPRYKLIWAVKRLKESDKQELLNLGFSF